MAIHGSFRAYQSVCISLSRRCPVDVDAQEPGFADLTLCHPRLCCIHDHKPQRYLTSMQYAIVDVELSTSLLDGCGTQDLHWRREALMPEAEIYLTINNRRLPLYGK
jgi:hypothetical protein